MIARGVWSGAAAVSRLVLRVGVGLVFAVGCLVWSGVAAYAAPAPTPSPTSTVEPSPSPTSTVEPSPSPSPTSTVEQTSSGGAQLVRLKTAQMALFVLWACVTSVTLPIIAVTQFKRR